MGGERFSLFLDLVYIEMEIYVRKIKDRLVVRFEYCIRISLFCFLAFCA